MRRTHTRIERLERMMPGAVPELGFIVGYASDVDAFEGMVAAWNLTHKLPCLALLIEDEDPPLYLTPGATP